MSCICPGGSRTRRISRRLGLHRTSRVRCSRDVQSAWHHRDRARMDLGGDANDSLPPCGGGMGRGVTCDLATACRLVHRERRTRYAPLPVDTPALTPLPIPPPQGGREACASLSRAISCV